MPAATAAIPTAFAAALDDLYSEFRLAPHVKVAKLLEMSDTQLRRLGNERRIVYRTKGTSWRSYAREDVENYLRGTACQSTGHEEKTGPSRPSSSTTISRSSRKAGAKVFGIAEARAKRLAQRQKASNGNTAS